MSYKMYDCIIIGGGAAGMMAAVTAASCGSKVLVIDGGRSLGTKILQTGNGKCNFTNLSMSADFFNNDDKKFVSEALRKFDQTDAIEFFKSIGVFYRERNGYVYPHSETAASLRDALVCEMDRLGVKVVVNTKVTDIRILKHAVDGDINNSEIRKTNNKTFDFEKNNKAKDIIKNGMTDIKEETSRIFVINDTYASDKLIIAAGSKAAPKTGSDGSGYELAQSLGHTIVKPLPALVQLISDNRTCKFSAGVRSTCSINLHCDDEVYGEYGEVQFTDYGISGIPVFQVSRHAVRTLDAGGKVYAEIDMIPDYSKEELTDYVKENLNKSDKSIDRLFAGIVNRKLVAAVCDSLHIDSLSAVGSTSVKPALMALSSMKHFRYNITGFKSFDNAQVCQGGVSLSQIDVNTMESKVVPGLYFAGEIMDVDGMCGGYNLQWAWTSGYIAGLQNKQTYMTY